MCSKAAQRGSDAYVARVGSTSSPIVENIIGLQKHLWKTQPASLGRRCEQGRFNYDSWGHGLVLGTNQKPPYYDYDRYCQGSSYYEFVIVMILRILNYAYDRYCYDSSYSMSDIVMILRTINMAASDL